MNIELNESQARFLKKHLELRIVELEKEAAHTDRRDLQHALAMDIDRLKEILACVEAPLRPDVAAAPARA